MTMEETFIRTYHLALRLGEVERATRHEDGRAETDTTHTVGLALVALMLAPQLGTVNLGRLLAFALVHDLVEAYAGDVCTAVELDAAARELKDAREAAALARIRQDVPDLATWIDEYEAGDSVEAEIVHYLDKMCPKAAHILSGGRALAELGLTLAQVRHSHETQGAKLRSRHPNLPEMSALFDRLAAMAEVVAETLPR